MPVPVNTCSTSPHCFASNVEYFRWCTSKDALGWQPLYFQCNMLPNFGYSNNADRGPSYHCNIGCVCAHNIYLCPKLCVMCVIESERMDNGNVRAARRYYCYYCKWCAIFVFFLLLLRSFAHFLAVVCRFWWEKNVQISILISEAIAERARERNKWKLKMCETAGRLQKCVFHKFPSREVLLLSICPPPHQTKYTHACCWPWKRVFGKLCYKLVQQLNDFIRLWLVD